MCAKGMALPWPDCPLELWTGAVTCFRQSLSARDYHAHLFKRFATVLPSTPCPTKYLITSSMAALSATGRSKVLEDEERRLKVDNFDIDFTIGQVFIKMNNLFNGENQLLADTVNKFLNDHSQEVIKEV